MKSYGYQCGWADKNCLDNSEFNPRGRNTAVLRYTPDPIVNFAETIFIIDDWDGNILDETADTDVAIDDEGNTYIGVDCTTPEAKNFCNIAPLYTCAPHRDNMILALDQYFYVNGDDVEPHESIIAIMRGIHDELKLPMMPIILNDNDWETVDDNCTCQACKDDYYSYECDECENQGIFSFNGQFNSQCFFNNLDPETV